MDEREELRSLVGSLRAYLEWHESTGSHGIPRGSASPVREEPTETPAQRAPAITAIPVQDALKPLQDAPKSLQDAPKPLQDAPKPAQDAPKSLPGSGARPLAVLAAEASGCTACSLHTTRTNSVFLRGAATGTAKIVFVGEAPTADDDASGLPFSGPLGELLDRMIIAMGLDAATDAAVLTTTKCHSSRAPLPGELLACSPFLHEQLLALAPKAIVALGDAAATALVGAALGAPPRGEWKVYRSRTPVMPTLALTSFADPGDPRAKQAKKLVWDDLQKVMDQLGLPRPTAKRR